MGNTTDENENSNQKSVQITETSKPNVSKRQLKKLKKYEEQRATLMARRMRHRKRLKARKANGEKVGISRKFLKNNKINPSVSKVTFVIDLDFEDLMNDRDIANCSKQLGRVYSINRRSSVPCTLYFSGLQPGSRTEKQLNKNSYTRWDVKCTSEKYLNIGFEKNKIVYLSSESDTVLDKLEVDTCYVIGGLVDHNFHKGLCYDRAQKAGIRTARLPLSEYIDIKTRTVLTINHVFEILSKVSEGLEWQTAIMSVIPSRKGASVKSKEKINESSDTAVNLNKDKVV